MMTSKTLIIAAFFAVCSSSCTAQKNDEKNAPLYGKTINIIGDSYVANHRRPKEETWHSMVASKYGMTYRNYGRNGCCIAFNRDKDGFGPSLLEKYKMMRIIIYSEHLTTAIIMICKMELQELKMVL